MMKGLVLGSGAARGYAHIGFLKVIESEGIDFDFFVGCSIGSVIGALTASGMKATKLEKLALSIKPTRLLRLVLPSRPSQAFINSKRIQAFLEELIPVKTFEELKKPLFIVATSLTNGRLVVFDSGPLTPAIMASISIPIIFPAVKLNGEFLVDGGVLSPLPVRVARERFPHAKIIGIDLSRSDVLNISNLKNRESLNIYETALYAVVLMQLELARKDYQMADLVISPDLSDFGFYEFYRPKEIIEKGEQAALENLEMIRKIL
jgi:NTE family protein